MALPAQSFVWFRLRQVIGLWALRETGLANTQLLWDDQNQPRPPLPYVGLQRRNFTRQGFAEEHIWEYVLACTATVTASSPGETAALILFGQRYAYTLQVGETTTDARDALLALITTDLIRVIPPTTTAVGYQPCTAVANGADAIDFAGFGVGPVRVTAVEGVTVTPTAEDFRAVAAGHRRAIVRVELFWPEQQDTFDVIDEYAEAMIDSLGEQETAEWLAARGVGVENSAGISAQNSSAASGGAREKRRFFDVIFNARSKRYRLPNALDSATPFAVELM